MNYKTYNKMSGRISNQVGYPSNWIPPPEEIILESTPGIYNQIKSQLGYYSAVSNIDDKKTEPPQKPSEQTMKFKEEKLREELSKHFVDGLKKKMDKVNNIKSNYDYHGYARNTPEYYYGADVEIPKPAPYKSSSEPISKELFDRMNPCNRTDNEIEEFMWAIQKMKKKE